MRLLLDTHIFLWFISGDARLPTDWRKRIRDADNVVYVSVVSLWEALGEISPGHVTLTSSPRELSADPACTASDGQLVP
jgi:PIN domain nuclease of toxin-antitoxin system